MVTLATRYTFAAGIQDAERYLYQRYVQLGLPVAYANWSYGGYSGRNIVAEIRGTSHPERIWLVGGHFDATSEIPYTRAPGADDNASGIAATLVIADILRSHRFSDTIRFVHFSAEEQGHWGSQAYARSLYAAGAAGDGIHRPGHDRLGQRWRPDSRDSQRNARQLHQSGVPICRRQPALRPGSAP